MLTGKPIKTQIPSLVRKSVITQNNFNLHPSQQELLLWHCRLGHACQGVQTLLAKPRIPRHSLAQGNIHKCIIIPSDHGASSCKPPWCEACQYAKQKHTTPINKNIRMYHIKRAFSLLTYYSLVTGSHVTNTCLPSLVDCLIPWERRIYYDNSLAEPYLLIMLPTSFSIVTSLILHSQPPFEASMPYNIICGPTVSNLITMHQIIIILSPKNG